MKYTAALQDKALARLLKKASGTAIGRHYGFSEIVKSSDPLAEYAKRLPVFTYNQFHDRWLHKAIDNQPNVIWPGRIKHFALTSGTSGAPSKKVPVSSDMITAIRTTSIRQMLSMYDLNMPKEFYQKQLLILGGSAKLNRVGYHLEGDLSGILASRVPRWFYRFRKPTKKVAAIKDWETKLDTIASRAHKWDIGIAAGVPAWMQILFERIIEYHKVDSIHDIWPNMKIYVHGGVAFGPYRDSIDKLMGKPTHYLDTYLASEGFFAFENAQSNRSMQLVLDKGIYFEFIPFNEQNFTAEGELVANPEVLNIHQVQEGVDYALVITTCSGLWRYLIGDTIKFTNVGKYEMIISGRTKHFLSLCGEHLSVDNMNRAVELLGREFGVGINEYTVAGIPYDGMFAHHWFLGVDGEVDENQLKASLDHHLRTLNDDYTTERMHALKDILVDLVPLEKFYDYMKMKGKFGGQGKFPRVLTKAQYAEWTTFIRETHLH